MTSVTQRKRRLNRGFELQLEAETLLHRVSLTVAAEFEPADFGAIGRSVFGQRAYPRGRR